MADQAPNTDRAPAELDAEDQKLVTLARSSRARTHSHQGAAVRDTTGRTYTAATVALPSLQLSALRVAVAMAVSSGATGIEAAAVVTADPDTDLPADDVAAVCDLGGADVPVLVADPAGAVRRTQRT